ncbi:P-loop containing nucleoside triphosphate hydrolase protein [Pisolithus microcarpus]|nr:P-loop containing nucleoside triphosphate hydrolase protein [Pisolithus microcarpus]
MWRTAQDQSILFSGEHTRGKSENRHLAIKTFLEFSVSNPRKKGAKLSLPQSSSSKRLEMHTPSLIRMLLGLAKTESLLFPSGERNFHIFYYLIAGPSPELKVALKTIGLSKQHAIQACQVVAAILHLGNLEFTIDCLRDVDTAVMCNIDTLALIAESLGVQPSALENALSYKTKLVKKELCTVFLDSDGASDNRNNLAKTLYSLLFAWLNEHINQGLCRDDFDTFIGLFDLPGPQNMTGRSNLLDQFCINFANERLHHFVQQCLFESHIDEYQSEECVQLFQNRPDGLIHIMDDQARWSHKKTDHTMLGGGLDRSGFPTFTICLFNGLVTYSSELSFVVRQLVLALWMEEKEWDPSIPLSKVSFSGKAIATQAHPGHDSCCTTTCKAYAAPTITEEEREDEDIAVPQNTGAPCIAGEFCTALNTLFDTLGDTQNCSRNDRSRDRFAVQGWSRLPSGGSNVQGGRDRTPAEQIERMRVALGLGETDVVLGQHKVFLSQATFHAMEDYLCAADVEEQKHNRMCEAEVEAVGVDKSTYANTYGDQALPLVRARPSIENMMKSMTKPRRSQLTGDQDDSNSNYGTESYPPSNMFQHVDKEGLMAKDPLPGETMEGETTEIVKETSVWR